MIRGLSIFGKFVLGCGLALTVFAQIDGAHASRFEVLYTFCSQTNCADGGFPYAGLITDKDGNLYGTTLIGGTGGAKDSCNSGECGTVFKLAKDGTETVLYSFCVKTGCVDGQNPQAGLIADRDGNLYGTTQFGGTGLGGTVFKLTPNGTETILHDFSSQGPDGSQPIAGLASYKGGLYGMTPIGGGGTGCGGPGCGVVFKVSKNGTESVAYRFSGGGDGGRPLDSLIADKEGNLFGTTELGGSRCSGEGCGVLFRLAPDGTETVLHAFAGGYDGSYPGAGLIADQAGNLYGTTYDGGVTCPENSAGCGTVFKVAPDGTESVLYSFCMKAGCADGVSPGSGLIRDIAGNLYGTTAYRVRALRASELQPVQLRRRFQGCARRDRNGPACLHRWKRRRHSAGGADCR